MMYFIYLCVILHIKDSMRMLSDRLLTMIDKGRHQCSRRSDYGITAVQCQSGAVLMWLELKDDYEIVKICIVERAI